MTKKEHTTITELFQVLDLLESLDMQFWLDGGWGVDVLYGQQTRLHRDIDIDFDANYTDQLLDLLREDIKLKQIGCPPVWNCIAKN